MNQPSPASPNPALVTQRAAQRLPRVALWLFCAAYVLPGLFGRDPWRSADLTAFGYMLGMAEGRTPWLAPTVGGLPAETALLPHWLGALFIQWLSPWMDPALAARLPFGALLALTLGLVWYATYHLARTEAAQPVPFAFGGEADPVDYARAMADGALLAVIATLGLLQLGHETTPELVQLFVVALFLWSLAGAPFRGWTARVAALIALPSLATSGAPSMAVALGLIGAIICVRSSYRQVRALAPWVVASTLLAAGLASVLGAWAWRAGLHADAAQWLGLGRLLLWFTWPVWPLALWTLWRWRRQLLNRHIAVPLGTVLVAVISAVLMGGSDRALMLAVPGLAVLAAFALPTLQRSTGAAVDWFSVFFFTVAGIAIWVVYSSMQAGMPAKPAANIVRLAPGFVPSFSVLALVAAALGSVAWLWLVRWRTSRHQHALWKSLVLPASGVALTWLLTMTLLLPVLDYARSPRALVAQIQQHVPAGSCLRMPDNNRANVAALETMGRYRVQALSGAASELAGCPYLLLAASVAKPPATPDGWQLLARVRRPTDRSEQTSIYRQAR
ncbi:MAG TPA: hypothetical protein VLA16_13425 [Ideonella sp.]|nr:hypothetical protein [Ideonella sp.]